MILIFGGAYQGKLCTAYEDFGVTQSDCYDCVCDVDYSYKVLNHFDQFILHLIKNDINVSEYILNNLQNLQEKIVIMTDITSGVVPMDATMRKWREEVGWCMVTLSKRADVVVRVYCGIATTLKPVSQDKK